MLPRQISRALDVAATLVAALITAYMTYAFFKLGWTSWSRGTVSATVVQTPLFIPQLIFAIGLATLFLQLVARLLSLATGTVAEAETIANRMHQE
jgi:TRAP-type C4-dicarboxylate transport system permease small subunit